VRQTLYNDSVTFRQNGIDSCVINTLPPTNGDESRVKWDENIYLDDSIIFNCHSSKDSLDTINIDDMKEFVEKVALKILK
jgi:hypothetical protein